MVKLVPWITLLLNCLLVVLLASLGQMVLENPVCFHSLLEPASFNADKFLFLVAIWRVALIVKPSARALLICLKAWGKICILPFQYLKTSISLGVFLAIAVKCDNTTLPVCWIEQGYSLFETGQQVSCLEG
ncbi:Uncharacterised protein [Legionella pneumophila]|nr:Uncharacterised protein [Legionella pneumophila]CZN11482.1 Uncharacterised protein [Legionella pneumophila]CZN25558.1 Uncharacterised protein [Legionella pneumophila]CZN73909.1 Uncharacterised protein [Legionella pneumophila]